MSSGQNRRDFLDRLFRLGGLFAALGSWNAWGIINSFRGRSTAPVPSRLLVSEVDEVIDTFLNTRGAGAVYYWQMFFPTFITGNELSKVQDLTSSIEARMGSAEPLQRPRLRVLPAIAAAHMLPLATNADNTHVLRDVFLKAHEASFKGGEPCRMALGNIWSCMTAVVIRNKLNWGNFLVGPEIVRAAETICFEFLSNENAALPLLHTAASSWQFLHTYKKALAERRTEAAADELRAVEAAFSRVRNIKKPQYAWLHQIDGFYRDRDGYENMLPEYLELVIGRSRTAPNTYARNVADYSVLIRMYTVYLHHLVAENRLESPYVIDPRSASILKQRSLAFLFDYGVSPNEWKSSLRSQAEHFLPKDGINYFDFVFENYENVGREIGAGGAEADCADWYSKHVPFRTCLPEESAAAAVYNTEEARKSALDDLGDPEDVDARLAFCLPAISYGCNLEAKSQVAKDNIHASVKEVKEAALTVLRTPRYATAFKAFSKGQGDLTGALFEKETDLVRLSLAGAGGDLPLQGKERMNESSHNAGSGIQISGKTSANPKKAPSQIQWKPRLGFYRKKKALSFLTDKDFANVLRLFWEDDELYGLPRNHAGRRVIIVPEEAVTFIRNRGFNFREFEVVSSGSLSPEKEAHLRRAQGMR